MNDASLTATIAVPGAALAFHALLYYCIWQSPRMLGWIAAKVCSRIDGIRASQESFKLYDKQMEERTNWQK